MPLGVVEFRDIQEGNRTVKRPFIAGTSFEVTAQSLRASGWGSLLISDIDKDLDVEYEVANNKAANVRRYSAVPPSVRTILSECGCDHAGLALDKFVHLSAGQTFIKHAIQTVASVNNSNQTAWFPLLRQRWISRVQPSGTASTALLRCTTTGPLTLHLARASALENAGICLHPLYGFVYLPGSGLKGMARAFAETVWLPTQSDMKAAWRKIEDVFGWASNPERTQQIRDPNHPAEKRFAVQGDPKSPEVKAHVGDVVFHDAWPETWPKLIVDIVNNHHPDYYQHNGNQHPPGDWENPVPVYFLAVTPGVTFTFPLAKRRGDVPDDLLRLASEWLLGALCHLGAGAKTNVGYGAFAPADYSQAEIVAAVASTWDKAIRSTKHRAEFSTTLELVTPAFLAGANQQAEDCDLRPAALRGHLRWWWRTMHVGFLDVQTLRALEAAIWGDTKSGGAVRIVVQKRSGGSVVAYDKRSKASFDDQQKVSDLGIPNGDARKTTQGLWYASYGMDESNRRRFVLEPPASWCVRLIARTTRFSANDVSITAQQTLEQAQSALWLLTRFGGVGSKAGKGFGSLSMNDLVDENLASVRQSAAKLRQNLNLGNQFDESAAGSASLQQMLDAVEVKFNWPTIWSILDQVGFAYSRGAQRVAHNPSKVALGLPRQIHGPRNQPIAHQNVATHRRPQRLSGPKGSRHTSPVRIHIERVGSDWLVRAVAFPATHLPDLQTSRSFLKEFLKDFGDDLKRRAALNPPLPPSSGKSGGGRGTRPPRSSNPPVASTVRTIAREEIKQRVVELGTGDRRLFQLGNRNADGSYRANILRPATVTSGYQSDGGWTVIDAPDGLDNVYVIAECPTNSKRAKFVEVFGRLPPASPPQRPGGRR